MRLIFALLVCVGCGSSKAPPGPAPHTPAGTLKYGGWTHVVGPGSYTFEAQAGDDVQAYVRSTAGAPKTRVLDAAERPVAEGALGHPDGDTMASASFHATASGTYLLVVHDESAKEASFDVQLVLRIACTKDADCERTGTTTGNPSAPSPLDSVAVCRKGACTTRMRKDADR
jgi:hypothetical protein